LVTMMESFEWLRVFESLPGAGAEEVERRRVERRREFEVEMEEFEERWGRGAEGTKATGTKAQRENGAPAERLAPLGGRAAPAGGSL
jgi:hypothetical protein